MEKYLVIGTRTVPLLSLDVLELNLALLSENCEIVAGEEVVVEVLLLLLLAIVVVVVVTV